MNNSNARKNETAICPKCDGKGKIRGFEHIANGVCFWCHGSGKLTITAPAPRDDVGALVALFAEGGCTVSRDDADRIFFALQCLGYVWPQKIDGGWLVVADDHEYPGVRFKVRDPRAICTWVDRNVYGGSHSFLKTSRDG